MTDNVDREHMQERDEQSPEEESWLDELSLATKFVLFITFAIIGLFLAVVIFEMFI